MTSAVAANPVRLSAAQSVDRLVRRQVHQMQRAALVLGERQVALHHHALGDRRPAADSELGRDRPLVHVPAVGERRVLAVDGQRPVGDRGVLQRAPHQRRRDHGAAVVREADSAFVCELGHLGQLGAGLALGDGGEEADRDLRVDPRLLGERAEDRGRVDDRLRVRHREDRAVAARRGRLRAAGDRLLVLAPRASGGGRAGRRRPAPARARLRRARGAR